MAKAIYKPGLASLCVATLAGLGLYALGAAPVVRAQADYSMVNARDTRHITRCGGCHLPYSPGLLPASSWTAIIASPGEHFGTQIELSTEDADHILAYLKEYALRPDQPTVMGRLAEGLPLDPPLRITQLPAFVSMHADAPARLGYDESDEANLAECDSCHRAAASHIFDKALLQIGHGDGPLSDYK